jgi:uncharacterized protein YndB with AHSA1/START domain
MLKWLGGCLAIVIVLVIGGSWWALHTMRKSLEPDGSARVAIAASPQRVFATLANADSAMLWMGQGNTVSVSQPGPLVPGSRIRIAIRTRTGLPQQPMDWIVREVVPNQLVVRELVTDKGQRAALRRDSLAAAGDSTIVISNLASPIMDSIVVARQKAKGDSSTGMAGVTADLMLSMFRIQSKIELETLKAHIEGKPLKR